MSSAREKYKEKWLEIRALVVQGQRDEAILGAIECMEYGIANTWASISKYGNMKEDFQQDCYEQIIRHIDDYKPYHLYVRKADTVSALVSLQHADFLSESEHLLLEEQENRFNEIVDESEVNRLLRSLQQLYPEYIIEVKILSGMLYFSNFLRQIRRSHIAAASNISVGDVWRSQAVRNGKTEYAGKTRRGALTMELLVNRAMPLSLNELYQPESDDGSATRLPVELRTPSAEDQFWEQEDRKNNELVDALFDDLHISRVCRRDQKKNAILRHFLESIVGEPVA